MFQEDKQHYLFTPCTIGTKSMKNTSAYEEPRSSGKRLHKYNFMCLNLFSGKIKTIKGYHQGKA